MFMSTKFPDISLRIIEMTTEKLSIYHLEIPIIPNLEISTFVVRRQGSKTCHSQVNGRVGILSLVCQSQRH